VARWERAEARGGSSTRNEVHGHVHDRYTSEKRAGFYKTYIELDSYGALDTLAAAVKDDSSNLGRLVREASAFSDYAWDAPWSNGLYKAVVDATVFDPG
jgi:hypothetical protein